jgi:ATP-dependent Lhr-like helicase
LLGRHGVLTRAVAPAESVSSFGTVYKVLRGLEERATVRRGYFVEGLGGSQFALPGAVDQLRQVDTDRNNAQQAGNPSAQAILLAATDPANAYGAALAWPPTTGAASGEGQRPGRKPGAVVVLAGGELIFFMERGGKTLLSFTADPLLLRVAANSLAEGTRAGRLGKVTITKIDSVPSLHSARDGSPAAAALMAAGFGVTPQGLRIAPNTRASLASASPPSVPNRPKKRF